MDLPLSTQARKFYKTGPPFLERHLPFWLAVLVQQVLCCSFLWWAWRFPLPGVAPRVFMLIQTRRVYGLYYELRLLEGELTSAPSTKDDKDFIERFDQLEDRASRLWVPASLRPKLYELRSHIRLVRVKAKK